MSTTFKEMETARGELSFTRFWGGDKDGVMVQLTQLGSTIGGDKTGFIQLRKEECKEVISHLNSFIEGEVYAC